MKEIQTIVNVTYLCKNCGEFEVGKTKSNLTQFCSRCCQEAKPIGIKSVCIKDDNEWGIYELLK